MLTQGSKKNVHQQKAFNAPDCLPEFKHVSGQMKLLAFCLHFASFQL